MNANGTFKNNLTSFFCLSFKIDKLFSKVVFWTFKFFPPIKEILIFVDGKNEIFGYDKKNMKSWCFPFWIGKNFYILISGFVFFLIKKLFYIKNFFAFLCLKKIKISGLISKNIRWALQLEMRRTHGKKRVCLFFFCALLIFIALFRALCESQVVKLIPGVVALFFNPLPISANNDSLRWTKDSLVLRNFRFN